MTTPLCVCGCGRPVADGYATVPCMSRAGYRLTEIAEMVPAARDIARGLSNHGGTGGSGKPGSRLPLDLGAMARLDAVERELIGWVRHVMEQRGGGIALSPDEDRIVLLARWLTGHLEWFRHRAEVDELLADIETCARVVRGIARGPAEWLYLGPCGTELESGHPACPASCGCKLNDLDKLPAACEGCACLTRCHGEFAWAGPCPGDVYGRPGAATGRCRTCSTEFDQDKRRAWLDEQTTDLAAPARDIAYSLGINVKTIRSWATEIVTETGYVVRRAKLRTYYRQGEHVVPWTGRPEGMSDADWKAETERRGPRLHYVGDVRALAQEADERKAEREATRDQAA